MHNNIVLGWIAQPFCFCCFVCLHCNYRLLLEYHARSSTMTMSVYFLLLATHHLIPIFNYFIFSIIKEKLPYKLCPKYKIFDFVIHFGLKLIMCNSSTWQPPKLILYQIGHKFCLYDQFMAKWSGISFIRRSITRVCQISLCLKLINLCLIYQTSYGQIDKFKRIDLKVKILLRIECIWLSSFSNFEWIEHTSFF